MEERIEKAVNGCYEAVIAPETWPDALHKLSRAVDAACTMFYPKDADKAALEKVPASHDYTDFLDHYIKHRWYEGHYRGERGWPLLSRGCVVIEHDLATDEERRRLRHYNELYLPFDFYGFAAVGYRVEGRIWAVSMLRYGSQGHFTRDDAVRLSGLKPHFARMTALSEKLAMRQASTGLDVLDRIGCPALLLDWRGAVARANTRAEALLGPDLAIRGGKLAAADRSSNNDLQALIRSLLARDVSLSTCLPGSALVRRLGKRPLLFEALPVAGLFADVFHRSRALLLVTDLDRQPLPDEVRLRLAFGLTPAESRLAVALAAGEGLKRAADSLGVSYETARAQLKSVFDKTDTRRQAELAALLGRAGSHV